LADTSVWAAHFDRTGVGLAAWINRGEAPMHPLVPEEPACGNLADRPRTLDLLKRLPRAPDASPDAVLALIESRRLMGAGLAIVDASLPASARLSPALVRTLDQALMRAAVRLEMAHDGSPPPRPSQPEA
jgi:hypothetical protein